MMVKLIRYVHGMRQIVGFSGYIWKVKVTNKEIRHFLEFSQVLIA